jgi:hypothetical protein
MLELFWLSVLRSLLVPGASGDLTKKLHLSKPISQVLGEGIRGSTTDTWRDGYITVERE